MANFSYHVCFGIYRNYAITGEDMYDLFGKYGAIRQVRLGNDTGLKTKGTAYVVSPSSQISADDESTGLTNLFLVLAFLPSASSLIWICP